MLFSASGKSVLVTALLFISTAQAAGPARRLDNVQVRMRDGVSLSADVYLPQQPGKYPVLLMRDPYLEKARVRSEPASAEAFTRRGYAVVMQDVRGRGDSGGNYDYHFQEGLDGYDSVEWAAAQPWSNGRVGMFGNSYRGLTQVQAIRERPPHLVCAMPAGVPGRHVEDQLPIVGGAWGMQWALQWLSFTAPGEKDRRSLTDINPDFQKSVQWQDVYSHRPLLTMDERLGRLTPIYREWISHPTFDRYWRRDAFETTDFQRMATPSLVVTGWFDTGGQMGSIEFWRGMRAHSPARAQQHLIIGAWEHGGNDTGPEGDAIGELVHGPAARIDMDAVRLAWFDSCLKGEKNDMPTVRVFMTGVNEWREYSDYPAPAVRYRKLYLRGEGPANSDKGSGRLDWQAASREERPDAFVYDPADPTPAPSDKSPPGIGGNGADQRSIEARPDVLVYTSDVLTERLEILGPVSVVLHAATDGLDTDWTAKLVDVHPDQRAVKIGSMPVGIIRARFRAGFDREVMLTPGTPEEYTIKLFDFGHAFLPGHRVRLEISSSAYPFFAPNPNTGGPLATETRSRKAQQTVFHDRARPSHVILPVMPAATGEQAR